MITTGALKLTENVMNDKIYAVSAYIMIYLFIKLNLVKVFKNKVLKITALEMKYNKKALKNFQQNYSKRVISKKNTYIQRYFIAPAVTVWGKVAS